MAVILIQETGQGEADANCYTLLPEARAIAEQFGWALPADDDAASVAIVNGFFYLNTLESGMCGTRTHEDQSGAFPRDNCYCGYYLIPNDGIKNEVKQAQVRAAVTYGAGTDVMPDSNGRVVASHQAGRNAVAQSYFNNGKSNKDVQIREAEAFLKRCYLIGSSSANFRTSRG